jgi:hypothetical protein
MKILKQMHMQLAKLCMDYASKSPFEFYAHSQTNKQKNGEGDKIRPWGIALKFVLRMVDFSVSTFLD